MQNADEASKVRVGEGYSGTSPHESYIGKLRRSPHLPSLTPLDLPKRNTRPIDTPASSAPIDGPTPSVVRSEPRNPALPMVTFGGAAPIVRSVGASPIARHDGAPPIGQLDDAPPISRHPSTTDTAQKGADHKDRHRGRRPDEDGSSATNLSRVGQLVTSRNDACEAPTL